MKKVSAVLLFLFATFFAQAERLNTLAEIYEEPGKQTIAQLYKGTTIYVGEQNKGWVKIIAVVQAAKAGYDEYTLTLPKKTQLFSTDNQLTGFASGKLKLPAGYYYTDTKVVFELVGYIRISEIDSNWVPERVFAKMVDSAHSNISFVDLAPRLDSFGFFSPLADSGFAAFQLNEVMGINYKNPAQRLKLVFYQNRLVAIFHKYPFLLKTKEVIIVSGRENLIYLRDLNAREKRIFGKLFLGE